MRKRSCESLCSNQKGDSSDTPFDCFAAYLPDKSKHDRINTVFLPINMVVLIHGTITWD